MHRLARGHAALEHADRDSGEQVDRDDDDTRDRVALDELRGAVHRAVEICFPADLRSPGARLVVGDLPCVEIGVDRHLLAGHRVEGEARRNLGDAPGAARDHGELDDDQDQEDDETDDQVAADDELAERVHDLARVSVEQDQPRHADIDREPEERRHQQERRERREVERAADIHRPDDDGESRGDVRHDEKVEQLRRQRHDHHRHDHDHGQRRTEVRVLQKALHEAHLGVVSGHDSRAAGGR